MLYRLEMPILKEHSSNKLVSKSSNKISSNNLSKSNSFINSNKNLSNNIHNNSNLNSNNNENKKNNQEESYINRPLYNLSNAHNNNLVNSVNQQQEEYERKMSELENEIEKLKSEKENVASLKLEYQNLCNMLNEEIDNFYQKKEAETKEFEKFKQEELKKIKRERKPSDRIGKVNNQSIIPSKKDKEEIECLKNLIAKMQEDFKIKDNNNKLTIEKLKRKLEESSNRVNELSKEVEDLTHKNSMFKSNSTNILKLNNNLNSNFSNNNYNNLNNNKKAIVFNEGNSLNNISANISPSTCAYLGKGEEILTTTNINKTANTNKSMNLNNSNYTNNYNTISNSTNNNWKSKYIVNNPSDEANRGISAKQGKNLRDPKDLSYNSNYNKSNYVAANNNEFNDQYPKKASESDKKIRCDVEIYNQANDNNSTANANNNNYEDLNTLNAYDDGLYDLIFLEKYHPRIDLNINVIRHENFPDGKIVKFYENDKREVIFPSGVRKEIFSDGYQIVYFNNKDIKQVYNFLKK